MTYPRNRSLTGMQLAWSPSTKKNGVTAELEVMPMVSNKLEFDSWLEGVKGKFVMKDMKQPTGRPDYNWEEFATPESFEKMKKDEMLKQRHGEQILEKQGMEEGLLIRLLKTLGQ